MRRQVLRRVAFAVLSGALGWVIAWTALHTPFPWGIVILTAWAVIGLLILRHSLNDSRRRLHALALIAHAIETQDEELLEVGTLELMYLASKSERRLHWPRRRPARVEVPHAAE